jgi:hypothetical protein
MSNSVIINGEESQFLFTKDEIKQITGTDQEIEDDLLQTINEDISKIAIEDTTKPFISKLKEKVKDYSERLNKYLLSPNLNFLIGTGCSLYAGAEPINKGSNEYDEILDVLKGKLTGDLQGSIESLKSSTIRIEQKLDKLSKIECYYRDIINNSVMLGDVKECISKIKEKFLKTCILKINYSTDNIEPHIMFIKRIVSRPPELNKVNIFTLNYDILLEKACEYSEVFCNNGFTGFHSRYFSPSSFDLNLYLKSTKPKLFSKALNLFKLHGSVSWLSTEQNPLNPYGMTEIQISSSEDVIFERIKDCIIYPIQTKKSHSLDLPYSELFRQFIENLHRETSTLIIIGYSFLDEHINDLIANALLRPDFHLVVFSYQLESELNDDQSFFKKLYERAKSDSRITIFSGNFLGNFYSIAKYLVPYIKEKDFTQILAETFKELKDKHNG